MDTLLNVNAKKSLSDKSMGQNNEGVLTELSDAELIRIVTLDIHHALEENKSIFYEEV